MDLICRYRSPLGGITLAAEGEALIGLWFDGQRHFGETLIRPAEGDAPVLAEARRWLDLYFRGEQPDFTPRLNPRGSAFRRTVWDILLTIPWGQTMTYGEIAAEAARRMGAERMSARAAGGAVGHNPISLLIPCHRVVGADGRLTGYAGGLERKARLLALERGGLHGAWVAFPAEG